MSEARARRIAGALLVALVGLAVASGLAVRLDLSDRAIDYDSANYAYVATRMTDHGERYLDRFNNKPPGIYWWYQAFFAGFGNGPLACHLTSLIPDLLVGALLVPLGAALGSRRVGWGAAALYAMSASAARLSGYGYTESPLVLGTVVASLGVASARSVGLGAPSRAVDARLVLAGVAVGFAALFKQPALLGLLGLAAWLVWATPPGRRMRVLVPFALGFGLVVAALGLWLAREGLLGRFVARVFLEGARHGYADGFELGRRLWDLLRVAVAPMPLILALALAGMARVAAPAVRGLSLAMAGPILVMCAASYEVYDHYLIPALPFLCLAAAGTLDRMPLRRAALALAAMASLQGLGNAIYLTDRPPHGRPPAVLEPWIDVFRPRDLSLSYQLELAAWVADRTSPDEPILATGSAIPYLARRENAYRFLGVAPYLGRLDATGFSDFPDYAEGVSVLVLERWRIGLLPDRFRRSLDDGSAGFEPIPAFEHPQFEVWAPPSPEPRAPRYPF